MPVGRKPELGSQRDERRTFVPTGVPNGIAAPEGLSSAAEKIWDVLLDDMISKGVFAPSDSFILAELCEALAQAYTLRQRMMNPNPNWLAFEKDIDRETREELKHDPVASAELWEMSGAYKRLRAAYTANMGLAMKMVAEYGITPVARIRLGLMKNQAENALAAFFASDDDTSDIVDAEVTNVFEVDL